MKQTPLTGLKIVAPISYPSEIPLLAQSGADELYCGILTNDWADLYGYSDTINRRQGRVANITDLNVLREIARECQKNRMPVALALNVRYTTEQIPLLIDLAKAWEDAGGTSLLVSDLSLLLALEKNGLHMERHLSILAAAFNSQAVEFYRRFGITRLVLPRSLTLTEMKELIEKSGSLEFEAMVLNEKCEFIDGLCGFYHGTSFPEGIASDFLYQCEEPDGQVVTYAHDLCYAGHACQIPFKSQLGTVHHIMRDDINAPHCAACLLFDLADAGVSLLKIGGRGLPGHLKARAVRYLKTALNVAINERLRNKAITIIKDLYHHTFGSLCSKDRCYYDY